MKLLNFSTRATAVAATIIASCSVGLADATVQPAAPTQAATATPAAPLADMAVTDPILIGYRLGYTLTTPQYLVLGLDSQIKGLPTGTGPDATAGIQRIDRLAASTRRLELRALTEAQYELQALGAPPGAIDDVTGAIKELSAPLETQATAEASKETDPATVRVLATLEEADRVLPKSWPRVTIWLKLTKSADALWGFRLGQLAASIRVARISSGDIAALGFVDDLRKTRPDRSPKAVKDALDQVDKKMRHQEVNLDVLKQLDEAIVSAYPAPPM